MEKSDKFTIVGFTIVGMTEIGKDHFGRFQFQGKEYMVKNSDNLSDEEIHKCLVELQSKSSEEDITKLVFGSGSGSYNVEAYTDFEPTKQKKHRLGSNKKTPKHKKAKNGRTKKRRK